MADISIQFAPSADDGSVIVSLQHGSRRQEHRVEASALGQIRRGVAQLMETFESRRRPWIDPVALTEFGRLLHSTFLAPLGGDLPSRAADGSLRLLFTSTEPDYLNLPWELLPGADGQFLVADARCTIRRSTRTSLVASPLPLVAPPLRVLLAACAPIDQPGLDYEKEEEAILRIGHQLGAQVHLEFAEAGTFDELRDLISQYQPHVVHLSGHGSVRDGIGFFAFENERGLSDPRDARKMAQELFAGRGVRLVFVNGCQTAQAAVAGVCQTLTASGHVPLAIGWAASIADDRATDFARVFFHELAAGRSVDSAVATARRDLLARCRIRHGNVELLDASFALPQLHAADGSEDVVDQTLPSRPPKRPGVSYRLLPDNIRGLREGFVGRRRQLQRTRPALRTGEKNIVLFTGIGGAGKSTLATRLANRLEREGWYLVALRAKSGDRLPFSVRLLDQLANACLFVEALKPYEGVLRDGRRDTAERLGIAIELLNRGRVLLVLDNLESLMRPDAPGEWRETEFAGFFENLIARLTGEGRAILTCRYVPEGFDPASQPNLAHEPMPDFTEADFSKYLRRHENVAQRMDRGELTKDLIATFHRKLGATPRFVEQACAILGTIEADALAAQLESLGAPEPGVEGDDLWRLQQAYFRDLFLPQLYEALTPPWRLALSRLALVVEALPLDGVARVAGMGPTEAEAFARRCVGLSLLQSFGERDEVVLLAIYPLQREFFTAPARLAAEPQREAHLAAAAFFRECFEQDREKELRLSFITELLACLRHATAAGDLDGRIWATSRLARPMIRHAEYAEALALVEPLLEESRHPDLLQIAARCALDTGDWRKARQFTEETRSARQAIGDRAGEAATWHELATIDLNEGNYPAARESFGKSLAIKQAIGNREGEAATWHQLASIDLNEGNYTAARESFGKSLAIEQAIGNRAGEAATWHSLATIDVYEGNYPAARESFGKALAINQATGNRAGEAATLAQIAASAFQRKRPQPAASLLAISFMILKAINSADQKVVWGNLMAVASALGLDQAGFDSLLREAAQAYPRDRGADLVRQAFAEA